MFDNQNYTWKERISYWFDNRMAEGLWPKVRLLLIVTVFFVLVIGSIAASVNPGANPAETFIRVLMYTLGRGAALTLGGDGTYPVYFLMLLLTIFYCMFLSSILFGFITNAVRTKVDELDKGQSRVIEENHTLVLGFNESTLELAGELIEANKNQKKQQMVVILANQDSRTMVDTLHRRFGRTKNHPMTKFICRTGDTYSFKDLTRCSIETARVVVISGNDDFETVKSIIACSHILRSSDTPEKPYMVTVLNGADNAVEAATAVRNAGLAEQLEFISLTETLARIMVHTSRQPGLSDVFTEIFNYSGREFYLIKDDPALESMRGRTIEEIDYLLKNALAVGVVRQDGTVLIDNPSEVILEAEDSLIVIEEDDDKLAILATPADVDESVVGNHVETDSSVNALVLGIKPQLDAVLAEYGNYLSEGSCVHVAARHASERLIVSEETRATLEDRGIELVCHDVDITSKKTLRALITGSNPDCVLVLADDEAITDEASDERTVRILLYMREYRKLSNRQFSITSEIHEGLNKVLVATTGPEDFIVGSHIAALLMAQISQEREISNVFDALLASEGYEVYMKPASWYVPLDSELDVFTISHAVAKRGDVFIGIHHPQKDVYRPAEINPPKFERDGKTLVRYAFGQEDMFVVLSNSGECD